MVLGGFGKGTASAVPLRAARNSGFSRLRTNSTQHLILGGAALQCVRENRLVFWGKMRQVRRYVTFSALQSGSSVLAAAQRERRVGRRSPEYFPAPRGGAVGYDRVRERVQR